MIVIPTGMFQYGPIAGRVQPGSHWTAACQQKLHVACPQGEPPTGRQSISAGVALLHDAFPLVERGSTRDRFRNQLGILGVGQHELVAVPI